jgi:putative methionine-R-sulfoxide reductase with GAF domain
MKPSIVADLARVADSEAPREQRARAAAEMIRTARGYRWVGIYDVGDDEIAAIGYSGSRPARETFSITQGLGGEAVRTRRTVAAASETIVPILGAESGLVIGALDVESERAGALAPDDVEFLEDCAALLRPLYD